MIRHLTLIAALGSALALTGCGANDNTGDSSAGLNQQESAADSGVSQATDAATQALFNQSAAGNTVTTHAVGMHAPRLDLARLSNYSGTVNVSTLVDAGGHLLYPNLSGSFMVSVSGSAVSSWPTGSNANANFTVVVDFSAGGATGLTYTDPSSGAVATISSGTITFQMVGAYTNTSTDNWVLTAETATNVAQGAPLDWTVTRANDKTRTVSLFGYRHGPGASPAPTTRPPRPRSIPWSSTRPSMASAWQAPPRSARSRTRRSRRCASPTGCTTSPRPAATPSRRPGTAMPPPP